jgi:hypothetical protein
MWPSLILGCAALTPAERTLFSAPFEDCARGSGLGMGSAVQAYKLLRKAWEFDIGSGKELGLDILLRDDLLCGVFL